MSSAKLSLKILSLRSLILLISSCITAVFCVLIAELFLQRFQKLPPIATDATAPATKWEMYPDTELSYRVQNYPENRFSLPRCEKSPQTITLRSSYLNDWDLTNQRFVILVIGDSFIYGHGVSSDQTIPAKIDSMLTNQGYSVTVLNAGTSGYGLDQNYLYLQRILRRIKPDLVIWSVHPNDLYDAHTDCLFTKIAGKYQQVPGWGNTVFIARSVSLLIPLEWRQSQVFLSFIKMMSTFGRFNAFCTKTQSDEMMTQQMLEKFADLTQRLKTALPFSQTKIVTILQPTQSQFVDQDEWRYQPTLSSQLGKLLKSQLPTIDVFESVITEFEPQLRAVRRQQASGIASKRFTAMADTFFLSEDVEPQSAYGSRHPNASLNDYEANLVVSYIKTIISAECRDWGDHQP